MLVLLITLMVAAPSLNSGVPLQSPSNVGRSFELEKHEPIIISIFKDGSIYLGEEMQDLVRLDELVIKLKTESRYDGSRKHVFIRGDAEVNYGVVAQAITHIKEAGFNKLSLVIQADLGG
ncbi:MAG: biopolymer transporter ExbD [Hyphomicrobiaceae bacterium]|nr:biopolymer transporter ExbD [Hyphomicrobiaceae bacterium]